MKKESAGMILILGGIAFMGFIWFKRNKPQLSEKQLTDLAVQSNNIQSGAETIDKPFEYGQSVINSAGINPYVESTFTMGDLTPKQEKDIKDSIGIIFDPNTIISNQISENMKDADFSQLGNLGLSNFDFSNIKIK